MQDVWLRVLRGIHALREPALLVRAHRAVARLTARQDELQRALGE